MARRLLGRVQWSQAFASAFAIVSVLPAFSGPFPAFSLATIAGKSLYLVTVFLLGIGGVIARVRENATRDQKEKERDLASAKRYQDLTAASDKRHAEDMAASTRMEATLRLQFDKLDAALQSITALMNRGVSAASPEMREQLESAKTSAATIRGMPWGPLRTRVSPGPVQSTAFPESNSPLFMPSVPSSGKPST